VTRAPRPASCLPLSARLYLPLSAPPRSGPHGGFVRLRPPAPLLAERHGSEAERADAETRVSDRDVASERHAPSVSWRTSGVEGRPPGNQPHRLWRSTRVLPEVGDNGKHTKSRIVAASDRRERAVENRGRWFSSAASARGPHLEDGAEGPLCWGAAEVEEENHRPRFSTAPPVATESWARSANAIVLPQPSSSGKTGLPDAFPKDNLARLILVNLGRHRRCARYRRADHTSAHQIGIGSPNHDMVASRPTRDSH